MPFDRNQITGGNYIPNKGVEEQQSGDVGGSLYTANDALSQEEADTTNPQGNDGFVTFTGGIGNASATGEIKSVDDDIRKASDFFAGEFDESTNNPNKTFKNIYWIDITKNNKKIPDSLRGRFWTHIQAGFLTEADEKTNYNIRAIGDTDYPQKHFGTVSNGIDESDDEFIGDISEYNSAELTERILENSYHRINTVYREYRKEILNLSKGDVSKVKEFDVYFNNPQTKVFTHNFGTTNVSVNFFSKSSNTSMDTWSSISYKIVDTNKVEVSYSNPNSNVGHGVITTITNLSDDPNPDSYEVGNLKEGYIYRPHYRLKIREFDTIITRIDDTNGDDNIPSYATLDSSRTLRVPDYSTSRTSPPDMTSSDGNYRDITINTYKYRRLLDIGETSIVGDGVDYPFKSGAHYLYSDLNFFLQRQDPPFEVHRNEVDLTLPNDKELFTYLVKSPNYLDFKVFENAVIDNDVLDGNKSPVEVSVLIKEYEGIYTLGDRYFGGVELNPLTITTKDLDDVC